MDNLDDYGCAGGMRRKAPFVPHGHSLQTTGSGVVAASARTNPACPLRMQRRSVPVSTARTFALFI